MADDPPGARTPVPVTDPKALVGRLVDEVINARDSAILDEIATPALARTLRRAFEQFVAAFPDWHQEIVELVAENESVVARFRCTGTHRGAWRGLAPTGRTMQIDEVYFFRIHGGRLARVWGLEDTWTRYHQLVGESSTLGEHGSLASTGCGSTSLPPTGARSRAIPTR